MPPNSAVSAPSPIVAPDLFKTSDYGAASYLVASGFEHSSLERSGRQLIFCFSSSPALVKAVEKYLSNSPIACRDYFRALRKTKAIIQDNIHEYTNDAYRN